MQREKPVRQHMLVAMAVLAVASAVSAVIMERLMGRHLPPITDWAIRAAFVGLIVAYFVLYARERQWPRVQFSITTILVLVTLAALDAWAWRTSLGPPVTIQIIAGLLLYWRIWLRRYEQLGCLSQVIIVVLMFFFLWLSLILTVGLLDPPKPKSAAATNRHEANVLPRTVRAMI
jgi:hypothetical protein